MSTPLPIEAELDKALAEALLERRDFADWLLGRTRFKNEVGRCLECRSDNPWNRVQLEQPNPASGEPEILVKECETDVLAIFRTDGGRRLGVHIEMKARRVSASE